ncbi:MAG: serine/threonine-protein kinase [Gammaproteobacteria bacterium]
MYGDFEVIEEIGRAPAGNLYLAQRGSDGLAAVIKTLRLVDEFAPRDQDEARKQFFREVQTASQLDHPCIRQILDSGETQGVAWLAMEHLSGLPLEDYISGPQRLAVDEAVEQIAFAADALAYAHGCGVVHRDICPSKIIYDRERGRIKITDFGFARLAQSGHTTVRLLHGKLSFKSPEDLAGQPVTFASDLFCLGVTLYQLLTGQLPFKGDSMVGLMQSILHEAHDAPSAHRPDLTPAIDLIVERALHKDPSARFGCGAEMAAALRACADAEAA